MIRTLVQPINPIQKRANSKIITMNNRYFLIGGMTITKNTCDIYQLRITNPQQQKFQVQWRPLKFQNHIFTPRNSFSVCASNNKIYIWGGLISNQKQMVQKCLSDLIQVDIQKGKMKLLPLKQNICIHSASLFYDDQTNSLIGFGGTNENSSMEAFLYKIRLDLQEGQDKYSWQKRIIKNSTKEGVLWQHTANIYSKSFINQQSQKIKSEEKKSKYLLLIGGCKFPWSPYKTITQIDLNTLQITFTMEMEQPLVAHQSIYDEKNKIIYIIGGANGGGFNQWIYKIKGQLELQTKQNKNEYQIKQSNKLPIIQKIPGHNAVGGACVFLNKQQWLVVYGGVCAPQMLNDMILYHN